MSTKQKCFNSAASVTRKQAAIDQHDGSAAACSHAAVSVEMKPGAFQPRSAAHADSTADIITQSSHLSLISLSSHFSWSQGGQRA